MKKLLIIGSLGMLGQELVKVFGQDKKYQVFAWDKNEIDISDQQDVESKISDLKPDIIINAAAFNDVDGAQSPELFEIAKKINGLAPGYLAKVAKNIGAVLVHFGTDYIFDGQKKIGYKEDDDPSPISQYGLSKLLGEKEIQRLTDRFYIIRLQKLFGLSSSNPEAKKSFFEVMLNLARSKKELDVVDEELANFTYAPDLTNQIKYILEKKMPFGIYHITNEGNPVTWFGSAEILFALAKKNVKLNPVPASHFLRPAKRPKYSILLNTKLPRLRPWSEALKEFLNK